jgi:hypothetical protein
MAHLATGQIRQVTPQTRPNHRRQRNSRNH